MSDETDYLIDWLREPITKAAALGHVVESDPPAGITRAERWTCTVCGDAVLRYGNNIYGSAVERECRAKGGDGHGNSFWDDLNRRLEDPEFREGYVAASLKIQELDAWANGEKP